MKLLELEPVWLRPGMFTFRCPCCRKVWLVCKNFATTDSEQLAVLEEHFGETHLADVEMARNDYAWSFTTGDFATLSVSPSIDASKSGGGHWHGHITNGEIR